MTRAVIAAFHQYTPMGKEFYDPIFRYFIGQMMKFKDEFNTLYLLDSTWRIKGIYPQTRIIEVNPSLRYYDAYKRILPQIKEDLVLFMDNDMLVWEKNKIQSTFEKLESYYHDGNTQKTPMWDVVSIYDTIGDYQTDKLNGKNKFCPYWFAARKDTVLKYRDVEWGPDMPFCETLGHLTEKMLQDGIRPYEWEEDKSSVLIDGSEYNPNGTEKGKQLGYYHVRAGSTPAYLLSTKTYGERKTYDDYLKHQPKNELLRQCAWYWWMIHDSQPIYEKPSQALYEMIREIGVSPDDFNQYMGIFRRYHGL